MFDAYEIKRQIDKKKFELYKRLREENVGDIDEIINLSEQMNGLIKNWFEMMGGTREISEGKSAHKK